MNLKAIVDALDLRVTAGGERLEMEVTGGYTSDLLSCAMAGAGKGNVWVTLQGHLNIVAVYPETGTLSIAIDRASEPR